MSACSGSQAQTQIITYVPVATAQAMSYSSAVLYQPESSFTITASNKQLAAARVNGQAIALEVYERQVARFEQALKTQEDGLNSHNNLAPLLEIRRQVLEMLIDQALIEQEAQRLQVVITAEELQSKANQTMAGQGSDQFEAWLASNHFTQLEFAETLRSELLASRVFERVTQNISDDSAKQQFFQEWLAQQKSAARIERYVAL
ncbi:MAG: SurA N-terminal domain-containing protein [Anaerolineae bacterium]